MRVYFFIQYCANTRAGSWSKRKFDKRVMPFVETREYQIQDYMKNGCMWKCYGLLITVSDRADALAVRKQIEHLCHTVDRKCKPTHFEFHETDVNLRQLYAFGGLRK